MIKNYQKRLNPHKFAPLDELHLTTSNHERPERQPKTYPEPEWNQTTIKTSFPSSLLFSPMEKIFAALFIISNALSSVSGKCLGAVIPLVLGINPVRIKHNNYQENQNRPKKKLPQVNEIEILQLTKNDQKWQI